MMFMAIFVSALPIMPLVFLVVNCLDIRTDKFKMAYQVRRREEKRGEERRRERRRERWGERQGKRRGERYGHSAQHIVY